MPAKLAALIPRLASDHDGEVVATARAIRLTLAAAGLDLHDLAAAVTAGPREVVRIVTPPRPDDQARAMVDALMQRFDALRDREQDFVRDMWRRSRLAPLNLTPKQAAWLSAIHGRVCGGAG